MLDCATFANGDCGLTQDDQAREDRINTLREQLRTAKSSDLALIYWRMLGDEIRGRSAEQVSRMETEKGLK